MSTKKTRIVVAGSGFGGVYTCKQLRKQFGKNPNIEIILINQTNYFLFTPLLHEVATGGISPENIIEPLRKVLHRCVSDIHVAKIKSLNTTEQYVQTSVGRVSYDYLVLALGSESHFFDTPGAKKFTLTLKTLQDATRLKNHFIEKIEKAAKEKNRKKRKDLLRSVIIGGGPTGVELATETAELFFQTFSKYYPKSLIQDVEIFLIQKSDELVPMFPKKIRQKARQIAQKHGIKILFNTKVTEVTDTAIKTTHKKYNNIIASLPIWTAGITPKKITPIKDFEQSKKGCIIVRPTLQTTTKNNIFALGDMAHCVDPKTKQPLPALAQVAVYQGKCVAKNIAALIQKKPLTSVHYTSKGTLISLGQWMAAGKIGPAQLSGRIIWVLWRSIYVSKLISWQKKIRVVVDWTINLFSPRDISKY